MVGVKSGQRPAQSVALPGQIDRFVRCRRVDAQKIDGGRKAPPGPKANEPRGES